MQNNFMDPFAAWTSFYKELEPNLSQAMQKWLESEEYAAFSGQLLNSTLQMEQQVLKSKEMWLQSCNIPTLKDFTRLGELLVGLEEKVDVIDERLIRLEQLAVDTAELRTEMKQITALLEAIGKSMPETAASAEKAEPASRQRKKAQNNTENLEESRPESV
jgi:polyhydroxyalkanoic acid synthase PhaR subunit